MRRARHNPLELAARAVFCAISVTDHYDLMGIVAVLNLNYNITASARLTGENSGRVVLRVIRASASAIKLVQVVIRWVSGISAAHRLERVRATH